MLPFEEALWRERGVDAEYVGHPACEVSALTREEAREALGLTPYARAVAILPGSRPHEVDRLLEPMLEAYERVRHERASVVGRRLLAPSLDPAPRERALRAAARRGVEVVEVDGRVGMQPPACAPRSTRPSARPVRRRSRRRSRARSPSSRTGSTSSPSSRRGGSFAPRRSRFRIFSSGVRRSPSWSSATCNRRRSPRPSRAPSTRAPLSSAPVARSMTPSARGAPHPATSRACYGRG